MRWFLVLCCCLMTIDCWGRSRQDSVSVDTIHKHREIHNIRETIRGLDRIEDEWIEPQHYEFQVMGQITRTYESFTLSSNDQSITLSADGQTKI